MLCIHIEPMILLEYCRYLKGFKQRWKSFKEFEKAINLEVNIINYVANII